MGEVIQVPQLGWSVLTSALLHAGVAVFLLMRIQSPAHVVPVGIDMLYLGETQAPSAVAPKTASAIPKRTSPASPAPAPAFSAATEPAIDLPTSASASSSAGPVGARDGAQVSALERYKYELRLFLESRKIYPETAKRLRQVGTVVVKFKVKNGGDLSDINIERAAASEILNRSALELIKSAARFKPIPAEAELSELQLSLPIEYIL